MVVSLGPGSVPSPVQRVGIIGGGQLAWMMAPAAARLGLQLRVQTPSPQDPGAQVTADPVLGAIADGVATARLAQGCEVISFENEFVNLATLETLAAQGVVFRPSLGALAPLLDKYSQRQWLAQVGLANPGYVPLFPDTDLAMVATQIQALGTPLVMKTQRLGYDGQGTHILPDWEACRETWEKMGRVPVLLEECVPFEQELAISVARSLRGEVVTYPVVTTQQVDRVCRRVLAPAGISTAVAHQAAQWATQLVESLDYVGILAIEFFLAAGDRLLVNEVAPRTHNSGHYSLDACVTSQFEQQLRAIAGLPLGSTAMTWDRAVMVNLLGYEVADHGYEAARSRLAALPHTQVYWYGKAARPGRKLGHVTRCLSPAQADRDWRAIAQELEAAWYP